MLLLFLVGGLTFGATLGQVFRVFVLVPASAAVVVLVAAVAVSQDHGILVTLLEIAGTLTALQAGYGIGLASNRMLAREPGLLGAAHPWSREGQMPRS